MTEEDSTRIDLLQVIVALIVELPKQAIFMNLNILRSILSQ